MSALWLNLIKGTWTMHIQIFYHAYFDVKAFIVNVVNMIPFRYFKQQEDYIQR